MQRAFPLLDDGNLLERREISFVTAFPGPGARDAFELVTRCLTDGRYVVDKELPEAANELESPGGRYYFRLSYRGRSVAVTLRPGYVREEFIQLARKKGAHGGGGACACRNETRHGRPPDGGQSGGYLSS